MPASDYEVFQWFGRLDPDLREVALFAFASFSELKYDWIKHVEQRDGHAPSEVEISRWISDLPESRLLEIRTRSVAHFGDAAEAYMEPVTERRIAAAIDTSILRQVERATSFRSTFLPNLFIGVVASVAFSLLVITAGLILQQDPSPFALLRQLRPAAR